MSPEKAFEEPVERMKVRRSHRIISGLLLVWLGLLQFPLPFAVRASASTAAGKDLSVPFPCMNRPCGCRSAEECWTNCCCTTREERIAFVIAHGLEMPAALLKAGEEPAPKKSCCAAGHGRCAACSTGDGKASCSKCEAPARSRPTKKTVLLTSVLKCKGQSSMLMQFGGAVLDAASIEPVNHLTSLSEVLLLDDLFSSVSLNPPAPPPRIPG